MRPVEHPAFIEEPHQHTGTFSFLDLCAQLYKQCFNIFPANIGRNRSRKDQLHRSLMFALHRLMVSNNSITDNDLIGMMRSSQKQAVAVPPAIDVRTPAGSWAAEAGSAAGGSW